MGHRKGITKDGFEFLLEETHAQVWRLLIVYMNIGPDIGMHQDEMLAFLFTLGSLEVTQPYTTTSLSETQATMLDDLTDLGIIYRPPHSPASAPNPHPFFYPTRLATTLTSSDSLSLLSNSAGTSRGHIILETNHRVYAYTASPLQVSILNLFTTLHSRFPNLVAGKISKESVQRAIVTGITSSQIITYLAVNAHAQMRRSAPILPPTVVDQIRLWQIEGDRMRTTPGFLLKEFPDEREYLETAEYADTLGVLVWRDDANRRFFATKIEQLSQWMKDRSLAAQQAQANAWKGKDKGKGKEKEKA
jgi:transcription initiation factor TFIIH subunit 4